MFDDYAITAHNGQIYTGGINVTQHFILMQSTGLRDRNDKLIFEGDIVKVITCQEFDEIEEESSIHLIIWGNDYPAFDLSPTILDDCNSLQYAMIEYEVEIISNIYQNPELLKEKE